MKLGAHSEMLLRGVHPDLVKVIRRAIQISKIDFKVLEGVRSVARQRELVKKGASQTMKSRHINGFAVDIAPFVAGQVRWDWPLYFQLAATVKQAAKDVGVTVEWGGDWKTFKDGPHWQLPARKYPDPK
jgi:peptidoglycan L-alanyl-D-glutamate endopeptidase CwlK